MGHGRDRYPLWQSIRIIIEKIIPGVQRTGEIPLVRKGALRSELEIRESTFPFPEDLLEWMGFQMGHSYAQT